MPGDFVARPLTLPGGSIALAFTYYAAFIDATEALGWMPSLSIGITSDIEVGFEVPVRYDEGINEWAMLDPIPHVAWRWFDRSDIEIAARVWALIPATSNIGAVLGVGVPFSWEAHSVLQLDAIPQLELGLEDPAPTQLAVPIALTVQAAPWLFTGVQAGPDIGLSEGGIAIDGHVILGLTLQTWDTAHLDVSARFFVENAGAGQDDRFSDGAGTIISVGFFPHL